MTINLEWHNTSVENQQKYSEIVKKDLRYIDEDLEGYASSLCFHHVLINKSYDDDLIFVWGMKDSDSYHCEYITPEWKEVEIDED